MKAQIANHREKPGGIWSVINKEKKPRDLIPCLKIPNTNPTQYERGSVKMAELTQNYHKELQSIGIEPEPEEERNEQIRKALACIPATQKLEEPEQTPLHQIAQLMHVERALKLSKNGSAAGIDRFSYKLWKELKTKHESDS
jgi:hypothetical protein